MSLPIIVPDHEAAELERTARRKAQLKKAQQKFRAANRERLNEKQRIARKKNLEKHAQRMREYRKRRPEVIAAIESRRVRPEGFRDKFNAYRREWAAANPEKISEHAHKRAGKRLGRLPSGTISSIGNLQGWKCAVCAVDLKKTGHHKDHTIPLALGGEHAPHNIQLLCPTCNLSKGAKDPIEYMRSKGRLL